MENREDWIRCPYCKLYFRAESATVMRKKRSKIKFFTCSRCGNDFFGGYYNRKRDENVRFVAETGNRS